MKVKIFFASILLLFLIVSCKTEPSVSRYFLDHQENDDFIALDISSNVLQLKTADMSKEAEETLKSVQKIAFLAMELKEDNSAKISEEKKKIKEILDNPKYKQLTRFGNGTINLRVHYLGEEDAIKEVIIFGTDKNRGLALVRILGENMNPQKIMELANSVQLDKDSDALSKLENILKGF